MMFTLPSPSRKALIIILCMAILGAGLFMFKDILWNTVQSFTTKTSAPPEPFSQPMAEMKGMPVPGAAAKSVNQAYAMVTPARQQLIGVKTAIVRVQPLQTIVRAAGRVEYDEQRLIHVNLRLSGWIEDLFVDYTGQLVRKDQPLFTLYSQELVTAQEEYLLALQAERQVQQSTLGDVRDQAAQMVIAARDRLRLWTLTEEQIHDLARRGTTQTSVTIHSPATGYVVDKKAFRGMFVKPEMTLYAIADLSTIWVLADIFEYEAPLAHVGQSATLTLDAYPGERFYGKIAYIYPYLNKQARTVTVRLDFPNPTLRLKPDMYGTVHLDVVHEKALAVPEEAVLDSGIRKTVFVVRGEGLFEPRQVLLGPKMGSNYEVVKGLEEGERIVTSGTFLLDSESKLMTSTNMMGALGMGGIKMEQAQMGQMEMPGMEMNKPGMVAPKKRRVGPMKKTAGGLTLVFSTEPMPARIGENRVRISITDQRGRPVSGAKARLTFTMPMPGMVPATVDMTEHQAGVYEAPVNLGMGGQWDLTVVIHRPAHTDVQESFSVAAGGSMAGMPGM